MDLETWAKQDARKRSTFGSSEFAQPVPQITKVLPKDGGANGYYLSFTTLSKVQTDKAFKPSVTGPTCSHGKALWGIGDYALDHGWSVGAGDLWAHWTMAHDATAQSASNQVVPWEFADTHALLPVFRAPLLLRLPLPRTANTTAIYMTAKI
jgi:hypothetical protein